MNTTNITKAAPRKQQPEQRQQRRPLPRKFEQVLTLDEVEGRTVQANRIWTLAQDNPRFRAELRAIDNVLYGLENARDGDEALIECASAMGLTAKEAQALKVISRYIKRQVKVEMRVRKVERAAAKETDA